jgi:hypothetical protein
MKNILGIALAVSAAALIYFTISEVTQAFYMTAAARTARIEAQKCASAFIASDYDTSIGFIYPRVLETLGGKERFIEEMRSVMAELSSEGGKLLNATVGDADEPRMVGNLMVAMIPETISVKTPAGKLRQDTSLLGISPDKGTTWYFMNLGMVTEEEFRLAFPELADEVTLPPKKEPILE